MEFGQVINPEYDPSKNHLYKAFHEYFNNPILTKIKNVNNFTVYMAKIHAMLGNSFRYLILFVNRDVNNTGTEKRMEELDWVSLQTRGRQSPPQHKHQSKTNRMMLSIAMIVIIMRRRKRLLKAHEQVFRVWPKA